MQDIILIRLERKWVKIPENELILLEASRNYMKVFTSTARLPFLVRGRLDDAEKLLMPARFCRVHRCYIIGLHHVLDISEKEVINMGIMNVPLSKTYAMAFYKRYTLLGIFPDAAPPELTTPKP